MKKLLIVSFVIIVILVSMLAMGANKLKVSSSQVPVPPELVNLPTIEAEPWLQITDPDDPTIDTFLEGPCFDKNGNLYVTSLFASKILKITPKKEVSKIYDGSSVGMLCDGLAIHKDGRIFSACVSGNILIVDPNDLSHPQVNPFPGHSWNDLVFDKSGNLYISDFTGNVNNPSGGVWRVHSPYGTLQAPLISNLEAGNGVSIASEANDGSLVLWVSETCRNAVIRAEVLPDSSHPGEVIINPVAGLTYPYYSTGGPGGCDSNRVDADGNLYQAMIFQGRVLILNPHGIPIANVVIPGRDEGKHLRTTNMAFKPGTNEVFLVASGDGGAGIYKFEGLAKGAVLYSHQP